MFSVFIWFNLKIHDKIKNKYSQIKLYTFDRRRIYQLITQWTLYVGSNSIYWNLKIFTFSMNVEPGYHWNVELFCDRQWNVHILVKHSENALITHENVLRNNNRTLYWGKTITYTTCKQNVVSISFCENCMALRRL